MGMTTYEALIVPVVNMGNVAARGFGCDIVELGAV